MLLLIDLLARFALKLGHLRLIDCRRVVGKHLHTVVLHELIELRLVEYLLSVHLCQLLVRWETL